MAKKLEVKSGDRYGRLTVIEEVEHKVYPSGYKERRFKCQCDCGNTTIVNLRSLRNRHTSSCGCLQKQKASEANSKVNKFDLSGDTFNIPFIKNGERIDDVIYASQGEQSFLSQAISFALSAQQLDKYNIVLLDEVDSTFDRENRERAIDVLEHQGENIHAEQMFVISHNDMYSQYPVDILDLEHIEDNKFDIKLS